MIKEYISKSLFDTLHKLSSLSSIVEKGRAIHLVQIGCDKYVLCGSGTDRQIGLPYQNAYKAVEIRHYKGIKVPLDYGNQIDEITLGHRERSYDGMKLKYKNREIVLIGPKKDFYPLAEEKQLELF